jgi:hypothetical protein
MKSSTSAYWSLLGNESYLVTKDFLTALNDVCLTNESRVELSLSLMLTTDGQSASLSWNKAPIWGLRPDYYYCQTVAGLLMWGAVSDERTGLSFAIAAGPR